MPLSVTTPMARDPRAVELIAKRIGLKTWPSFIERACCEKKEPIFNGGWRASKSTSAAFLCLVILILHFLPRAGKVLVWIVGPDYEQARPEYFLLVTWLTALGFQMDASTAMQGSLHATATFGTFSIELVTKSAKDPTSLGSFAPDVILSCEAGQIPGEADAWLEGRTAQKNAWLIRSGTFENDEEHPQYEHFKELSQEALDNPTSRRQAFAIPTWENAFLFGDCRYGDNGIENDPALREWCPDENHGPDHAGINHPMLRQLHYKWRNDEDGWRQKYGGEPIGARNLVYPWTKRDRTDDFSTNHYLVPMPKALKESNKWLISTGGIDFGSGGDNHPSAITICSIAGPGPWEGQTWVRFCLLDTSGAKGWIKANKEALQKAYRIPNRLWGGDPVATQFTGDFTGIDRMSSSLYSRMARVGWVRTVQLDDKLFFDADNEGVRLLFKEMQGVRFRIGTDTRLEYIRKNDDMTASFEDAMGKLHGEGRLNIPKRWKMPSLKPVAAAGYRGRS